MQFDSRCLRALATFLVLAGIGNSLAQAQEVFSGKFGQQSGEDLFRGICQGCHMPDAKGAAGAGSYPALASNPRLAAAIYPISVVVNGQRAMPPFGKTTIFGQLLTDTQIANVVNYVRTHFGNHYRDVVTPEAVKAARR